VAAEFAKLLALVREKIPPTVHDAAGGARDEPKNRAANRRLPAAGTSKLTPSTAFTCPTVDEKTPRLIGNQVRRLRTSTSGEPVEGLSPR
jgi:hypothetical protein